MQIFFFMVKRKNRSESNDAKKKRGWHNANLFFIQTLHHAVDSKDLWASSYQVED